jgi:hypothetical protein
MVGGLVQDEKVGLMAAQHGKGHTGLLPSGEARCTSILFFFQLHRDLKGLSHELDWDFDDIYG